MAKYYAIKRYGDNGPYFDDYLFTTIKSISTYIRSGVNHPDDTQNKCEEFVYSKENGKFYSRTLNRQGYAECAEIMELEMVENFVKKS